MSKSFRAVLAEQDEEFTYHVKSIYNIHDDETMDWIRLALLPYDLRDIQRGSYKPMGHADKDFPNVPGAASYDVKVVLGLEPPTSEDAEEKVALFTRIKMDHLLVHKEGEDPHKMDNSDDCVDCKGEYKPLTGTAKDFSATLDNVEVDNAQSEAGEERIGNLVKELEKERKEREELIQKPNPKLKEAFCTSHIQLNQIDKRWTKGFYLVERHIDDTLNITGPFSRQADNYPFVGDLLQEGAGTVKYSDSKTLVMEDADRNFKFTYRPVAKPRTGLREEKFSVEVQNQDSGKTFSVIVDAVDDAMARDRAVNLVARREKLNKESLIARDPESSGR